VLTQKVTPPLSQTQWNIPRFCFLAGIVSFCASFRIAAQNFNVKKQNAPY